MTSKVISGSALTRRDMIATSAAGVAALTTGGTGFAAQSDTLHLKVADSVRQIAGADTKLRLMLPNGSAANVRPVVKAFLELTGVTVEEIEVPVDEINTQLTLDALDGGADYDLALPATFGIPDLAADGVIRPISDFAARHEPEGFRDAILYGIGDTFDGQTYGFQADGDTYIMFYHRDWLNDPVERDRYADLHGTELAIPKTWHELDRQMAFFHRPDEGRYGGALFRTPSYLAWEWWIRFHSKGIWPLSADLEPQIASAAGIEALEEMIRSTDHLYPQARSAGLFDNWEHYGAGNTYCNIGWGGSQKYLNGPKSQMRGRLAYGPTPCGAIDGQYIPMPYFNWGWNYVVTSISKQPELAYLFALFASTSEMSTLSVREPDGYFDPFRPEHYKDPIIVEAYSPEFLTVHEESLRASIPDLYLASQGEYFRILSEWLDAAVNKGVDAETALTRASTQWSVLNLRVGRDLQHQRWLALREKYPLAARQSLRDLG